MPLEVVAGVGGRFPSNRATELTNQINITLASDLGASFSGTAIPVVCLYGRSPLVSRCPHSASFLCPETTEVGPGWNRHKSRARAEHVPHYLNKSFTLHILSLRLLLVEVYHVFLCVYDTHVTYNVLTRGSEKVGEPLQQTGTLHYHTV